ncbi:MAG: response regulator [Acidimicrobiia bacterium]
MIKVLVVDDHAMVRTGLTELLRQSPELQVVGEAANGEAAIEQARATEPDVVLMDLAMPIMDGVAATRVIVGERPNTTVVALTTYHEPARVRAALDAGAMGYLLKDIEPAALIAAIHTAYSGGVPLSPVVARRALRGGSRGDVELSGREREILLLVQAGHTNREIGARLSITEKTVKAHMGRIFQRLGVSDRGAAAEWASNRPDQFVEADPDAGLPATG